MIAALILAAGRSERMGFPKALARIGDMTFLERVTRCIADCGIDEWRVVAGRHALEIGQSVAPERLVVNPDYAMGMTTSFQAGIRALPSDVTVLVVCLVDHPLVSARTVGELLRHADASDIVVPTFEGRRGHPVVFSPSFMRAILELPADRGVNSLIREQGRVLEIPVPDPGIVTDIDTPGELGRAGGRLPGPPRPGAE